MLTIGLLEMLWLSCRFGPELPGSQGKRPAVHYTALLIKK